MDTNCSLHHIAIQTGNFDRAFNFYSEFLGLKVIKPPFNFKEKRTLAWLSAGNALVELYSIKKGTQPYPYNSQRVGADHVAFNVKNLKALIERFNENGIRILKDPFSISIADDKFNIVFIEGPDGEEIELAELEERKT